MGAGQDAGAVERRSLGFSFNGRPVRAYEGDTVACALVRAGVHTFSRSMKFHRPRGMYCGAGRCISCTMRVNGIPGVRTCTLPVAEGMVVESQGGFPGTRFDMLSVLDHVFRRQFDYHSRFIRPKFLTPIYQRMVRRLAASGRMPDGPREYPPVSTRNCRVLVIGQGVSGSVAAARLRATDMRGVIAIDSMLGSQTRIPSVAFGIYEGPEVGVQVGEGIQLLRPEAILLATGRHETGLPIPNADLPGVFLPSALAQLASHEVAPGESAVVIGSNWMRETVLRNLTALGVRVVKEFDHPSSVGRIVGTKSVEGVETSPDGPDSGTVPCDTVVILGPLIPAVELAQQAGCELSHRDGTVTVKVDSHGRTNVSSVFACGSVAGSPDQSERISSGQRAADAISKQLGVG